MHKLSKFFVGGLLMAAVSAQATPLFSGHGRYETYRKNGHTYCRKKGGTEGAIIGGVAGALLGNQIAGHGNRTLGTIIGGAGGAAAGHAVARRRRSCAQDG